MINLENIPNIDYNLLLDDGIKLVTRYAISIDRLFLEYEVYQNGKRIYDPFEDDNISNETYSKIDKFLFEMKTKFGNLIPECEEERMIKQTPKMVWISFGTDYPFVDSKKPAVWISNLGVYSSIDEPDSPNINYKQFKLYTHDEGWGYYSENR